MTTLNLESASTVEVPADQIAPHHLRGLNAKPVQLKSANLVSLTSDDFRELCDRLGLDVKLIELQQVGNSMRLRTFDLLTKREHPASGIYRLTRSCRMRCADQIGSAEQETETVRKKLETELQKMAKAREALFALHRSIGRGGFDNEFDLLMAHDDVKSVQIDDNRITVETNPIVIEHKGMKYSIGEFRLVMDTTRGCADHVSITNLTRTVEISGDRYHHPHICGRYKCFGNHEGLLNKFLRERRFCEFIILCLRFLNTYYDASKPDGHNPWGHTIERWK